MRYINSHYITTICHAGQQPMTRLSRRTATTTRFRPKTARNRRRQGIANISTISCVMMMILLIQCTVFCLHAEDVETISAGADVA